MILSSLIFSWMDASLMAPAFQHTPLSIQIVPRSAFLKKIQQDHHRCLQVTSTIIILISGFYYRCNNNVDSKVCFCVNAWAWRQRHSQLNCLITEGSTWDWDDCLLFMLLLCVVIEWETWCCGSTIIENSKQKTTKHR